jgi:hypothetical protein
VCFEKTPFAAFDRGARGRAGERAGGIVRVCAAAAAGVAGGGPLRGRITRDRVGGDWADVGTYMLLLLAVTAVTSVFATWTLRLYQRSI